MPCWVSGWGASTRTGTAGQRGGIAASPRGKAGALLAHQGTLWAPLVGLWGAPQPGFFVPATQGVSPGLCSSSKPRRGPCQGSTSSSYRSLLSPRRPGEPGQGKPWSGQGTAPTVKGQAWAAGSRCRAGEREHPRYGPILVGTTLRSRARYCLGHGLASSRAEPSAW